MKCAQPLTPAKVLCWQEDTTFMFTHHSEKPTKVQNNLNVYAAFSPTF